MCPILRNSLRSKYFITSLPMIQHHIDLKSFHSFKFDCVAQDFCTISNKQDRDTLCQQDIDRSSVYIL